MISSKGGGGGITPCRTEDTHQIAMFTPFFFFFFLGGGEVLRDGHPRTTPATLRLTNDPPLNELNPKLTQTLFISVTFNT